MPIPTLRVAGSTDNIDATRVLPRRTGLVGAGAFRGPRRLRARAVLQPELGQPWPHVRRRRRPSRGPPASRLARRGLTRLRDPARTVWWAGPAPFAAERQQRVMPAVAPPKPQMAMSPDAAIEEGTGRVFDEALRFGSSAGLCLGDELGLVLLHQAVQRVLFGTAAMGRQPVPVIGFRARRDARKLPLIDDRSWPRLPVRGQRRQQPSTQARDERPVLTSASSTSRPKAVDRPDKSRRSPMATELRAVATMETPATWPATRPQSALPAQAIAPGLRRRPLQR